MEHVNSTIRDNTTMSGVEGGYDVAQILEVLIKTLVQKKVLTEQEANYIRETGKGATFRQA
jgi:hypothetical protein